MLRRSVTLLALLVLTAGAVDRAFAQAPSQDAPPDMPTPTTLDRPELVQQYQATITAEELAGQLFFFASDFFEGRETTARGQKLAAQYLASQYQAMGLTAAGSTATEHPLDPDAYLQPFPVYGTRTRSAGLRVTAGGEEIAASRFGIDAADGDAYLTFGSASGSGPVVFAGYGIADAEHGYNDYAALEAAGVTASDGWLLVLDGEPLDANGASRLTADAGTPSSWSTQPFNKYRAAFTQVARPRGLLIVDEEGGPAFAERVDAAVEAIETGVGSLSLEPPEGAEGYPPMYRITPALANRILAPQNRTVEELRSAINAQGQPVVFAVEGVTVTSDIQNDIYEARAENVVAYVEGSDPVLKDEFVVISSHYDHIGIDATGEDRINNGADDDGSGSVALLELAEAFMQARADGYGPRRSVLFLHVSGEEKGLLGSAYFADIEPLVPLDRIVTNLNIDMIGRYDPTHPSGSENYVYIIGSNLISQELHDLNARANEETEIGIELDERFNSKDDPNRFYARSDHWNFGKHGIPFIFYFTGTHDDYHAPGDEADKIEYDRMARITRLIFATAWQVANQDDRPAVSGTGFN